MHLFNLESLTNCYHQLEKDKAVGIDGVNKAAYGKNLERNLQGLLERMKAMAYRPGPVREVRIPKEGRPGATRPLGISNLEDKIVQRAMVAVLNVIYEEDFLGFSYGFRPERSQHHALDALYVGIMTKKVSWVLDADIRAFLEPSSYCTPFHERL